MCRSIKQLRQAGYRPTEEEVRAAALQFVRKVSGYRQPSRANQDAFERAVEDVAAATRTLLADLARSPTSASLAPSAHSSDGE